MIINWLWYYILPHIINCISLTIVYENITNINPIKEYLIPFFASAHAFGSVHHTNINLNQLTIKPSVTIVPIKNVAPKNTSCINIFGSLVASTSAQFCLIPSSWFVSILQSHLRSCSGVQCILDCARIILCFIKRLHWLYKTIYHIIINYDIFVKILVFIYLPRW